MKGRNAVAAREYRGGTAWSMWAVLGVTAVFIEAIVKLAARGLVTVRGGLEVLEWLALLLLAGAFLYGEGVRALQRRWVPHVLERSQAVRSAPLHWRLLAPLYAMLLVGAPRRTLARAWLGVLAIVAAVLLVRALPEPWRGIVDLAVAGALAWGLGALLAGARRLL